MKLIVTANLLKRFTALKIIIVKRVHACIPRPTDNLLQSKEKSQKNDNLLCRQLFLLIFAHQHSELSILAENSDLTSAENWL